MGVIALCTMPYSYKVFWSPLIELYHLPALGKRKSWIVPTQLFGSCILLYLSYTIEDLLMTQQVHFLLYLLLANTFVITCQDIAVDSWSVEILTPEHASYQSGAQAIG